ncbi:hypothetical protein SBY92_002021 [Candida maltosa Xu316]
MSRRKNLHSPYLTRSDEPQAESGHPLIAPQSQHVSRPLLESSSRNIENEQKLLKKFEDEVLSHDTAAKTLANLQSETRDKYMYQIRRYIRHCANKGFDNFYVEYSVVKDLIVAEIDKRGQITENTIKSLRSSLNKLYHMNRIVYSTQQPIVNLGDNIVTDIMSTYKEQQQQQQQDKQVGSGEGGSTGSSSTPLTVSSHSTTSKESSTTEASSSNKSAVSLSTPVSSDLSIVQETKDKSKVGRGGIFKLSESSKIKLSPQEEFLLKKFNQEVLQSDKTVAILESLTVNTFKSYATDMKRFIRFCARHGKTDTLIEKTVLNKFLTTEVDKSKKSNSKKLRTSLLKLHQLNCEAYNLDYSEGDIVFLINKFLDGNNNSSNTPQEPPLNLLTEGSSEEILLAKLDLDKLTEPNKILHKNEFKRYASFCSHQNLQHFHVESTTIKSYFDELTQQDPNMNARKLKKILKRLTMLHNINLDQNYDTKTDISSTITEVDEYLATLKKKIDSGSSSTGSSSGGGTNASNYSGGSSSISSLTVNVPPLFFTDQSRAAGGATSSSSSAEPGVLKSPSLVHPLIPEVDLADMQPVNTDTPVLDNKENDDDSSKDESSSLNYQPKRQKLDENLPDTTDIIPPFVMNSDITTVTQLVEEWTLIIKRTSKWGLGWIKNQVDFQIYNNRKVVIEFIEGLLPDLEDGAGNTDKQIDEIEEDYIYDIAKVFDEYLSRKEISLLDLIQKIETNPAYSRKEFLRILTRRKS